MKKQILLFLGLITVPLLTANAQLAQPSGQTNPLINVSGSAEVKVAPDEVDLSVSVEARDASLEIAKQQNDDSVTRALDFLKQSGVKDKDIQTDYISIEPVFDPGERMSRNYEAQTKPLFYRVSKGIAIKLTDVRNFEAVLTGLITNGVNKVQGIDFHTSELRKHKDQARAMAIRAAKEKADAMAAELGVKVGKPFSINVEDAGGSFNWLPGRGYGGFGGGYQNAMANNNSASEETGPAFAVGQISVSANVTVSFLIQ